MSPSPDAELSADLDDDEHLGDGRPDDIHSDDEHTVLVDTGDIGDGGDAGDEELTIPVPAGPGLRRTFGSAAFGGGGGSGGSTYRDAGATYSIYEDDDK